MGTVFVHKYGTANIDDCLFVSVYRSDLFKMASAFNLSLIVEPDSDGMGLLINGNRIEPESIGKHDYELIESNFDFSVNIGGEEIDFLNFITQSLGHKRFMYFNLETETKNSYLKINDQNITDACKFIGSDINKIMVSTDDREMALVGHVRYAKLSIYRLETKKYKY